MRTFNSVTLLGYVGHDPEVRHTDGDTCVANFSIATRFRSKDKKEVTEWHRATAFGRAAEIVRDYVYKGSAVFVQGHLQTRSWEENNMKRYTTEIVIVGLSILGSKHADQSKAGDMRNSYDESVEVSDQNICF